MHYSNLPIMGSSEAVQDPMSAAIPRRREDRWQKNFVTATQQVAMGTKKLSAYGPRQAISSYSTHLKSQPKKVMKKWTMEQMSMVALVAIYAGAAIMGAYADWNWKHTHDHHHHHGHGMDAHFGYPSYHNGTVNTIFEDDYYTLWSWLFGGPDSSHAPRGRKKHHRRHHSHHHHHHRQPRRYVSNTARNTQRPIYPLPTYGESQKTIPVIAFWDASHQRGPAPESKQPDTNKVHRENPREARQRLERELKEKQKARRPRHKQEASATGPSKSNKPASSRSSPTTAKGDGAPPASSKDMEEGYPVPSPAASF